MVEVVTFDGPLKKIYLSASTVELDVEGQLYSAWKRWAKDSDNAKYLQAFRTVGGDPTAAGQFAPKYFFLLNGWQMEISGNTNPFVEVALNLYVDGGGNPFNLISGASVSNLRSDIAVIESDIANALDYGGVVVYDEDNGVLGTTHPVGTSIQPVNNTSDLKIILDSFGITNVILRSNMTVVENFTGIIFESSSNLKVFNPNNKSMDDCYFKNLKLSGDFNDSQIIASDCVVLSALNVYGIFKRCQLAGQTKFSSVSSSTLIDCFAGVLNPSLANNHHVLNFESAGTHRVNIKNVSGYFLFANSTDSNNYLEVDMHTGKIDILASCTAGTLTIRGMATVDNQSLMTVNDTENFNLSGHNINISAILGLSQSNFIITGQTYNGDGNLTDAVVTTYLTSVDAIAGTNPSHQYIVSATYDGAGILMEYSSIKTL